jgi:1-acyl-sn-glycerol-3-phosphate acyltransferase
VGARPPVAPIVRPPHFSLWRRLKWQGYFLLRHIVRFLCFVVLRMRVRGEEHVPPTGPLIVVANHLHNFDVIVLSAAVTRPIFYMAKRELYRQPLFARLLLAFGSFPINRDAIDRAALKQVGLLLDEGMVVGILPEGTRSTTRALTTGNPGVALLAYQRAVPILPVAITGVQHLPFDAKATGERWFGRPVTVTIGEPFYLPAKEKGVRPDLQAATDRIMLAIAALLPPEYQGVYREPLAAQGRADRG